MADGNYASTGSRSDIGARVCKRKDALAGLRQPHEQVWKDCFDYTHPLRGDGFQQEISTATEGLNKQARLFDATATDAARLLTSSIMSGLTPANALWIDLSTNNETHEEHTFLANAATLVWQNIHGANFDSEAYESNLDIVEAGWFVLYTDFDRVNGGLTFEQWHISRCYIASSRKDGVIDTIYRCFELSAEATVNEYGAANCSPATVKLSKDKPDQMVKLLQCIEPRLGAAPGARMAKGLPFASYTIEEDSKLLVRESGYHEFPCCVPRWMKIPKSSYGVGPVFDALPDIRMVNTLAMMELDSADIAISGMWIAADDGVLNPRTIKIGPKKVIVASSVDAMKPLQTGANFQLSEMKITQLQASIRKIMMADQLQPQDGPQMTATEVHVRVELIRQLLGPVYGRLQAEYLKPLVERCFGILYRAGILGQAPASLMQKGYTVKYDSPIARAQRMGDVAAIQGLVNDMAGIAGATQDASIFDNIDLDAAAQIDADNRGVPASIMRSPAAVQQVRAARQQAQQAQQQAASLQQTQGAMNDGIAKGTAASLTGG